MLFAEDGNAVPGWDGWEESDNRWCRPKQMFSELDLADLSSEIYAVLESLNCNKCRVEVGAERKEKKNGQLFGGT